MASETLVIRLLAQPSVMSGTEDAVAAQWLLVDNHGARLGAVLQGSLQEAAALAAGRRVIVLVPGAEALHVEPLLPPLKGGAKPSQVVPYALEDQLASDVDALHFAMGKRESRPGTPVIVVSHDAMQSWIFALRAVGLNADALYTDTSLLPATRDGVTMLIDNGRVSSRPYAAPVTTLDISPLSDAMELLLPADPAAPVAIYVSEAEYDAEQNALESIRQRMTDVQIKLLPDGVLPLLALQAVRHGGINLLQGVYTPRGNFSNTLKPWRLAASLVAGLVVAHVLVKSVELFRLGKRESTLDQQIAQTWSQSMPGVAPVPADSARRAIEQRMGQLQTGGNNGLMLSLSTLSDTVGKVPDLQLDAVSYRNDNVDLRILAPDVGALEQIRQHAQARGVSAEIQSANPKDNRIDGRIQLRVQQGARS